MDNILEYLINLSIFVPLIIILIVVSIKLSKSNLGNIGMSKYIEVIERTNLNKDTYIFVLKLGDEGCVVMSSPSSTEKIKNLSKEEISNLEQKRKEMKKTNKLDFSVNKFNINKLDINKLNLKEKKNGDTR